MVKTITKNLISIVIPRHGEDLTEVLASINASNYKNYEIIVVDEGLERSAQRNIGIKRAKGDYLLILDADQCIHRSLLMEAVYCMKHYNALYIPEIIKTKGFFGYLRNWERQFYTGTAVDCVRFVRRKDCPLFNLSLNGPEDADWSRRVKGKKGVTSNPLYHYDNIGFIKYLKKKTYYAKSMRDYALLNPDDKCLNFWWRCFGVFFEQGKWRMALRRLDLMILVWSVILIRGVLYLWQKSQS